MTLREQIAADVSTVFLNTDDFAETVTYIPRNGRSRRISAVVDRSEPMALGLPDVVSPQIMLWVANDRQTGIASELLDTGGDKVRFDNREDEAEKDYSLVRLVYHDHAMCQIEVS